MNNNIPKHMQDFSKGIVDILYSLDKNKTITSGAVSQLNVFAYILTEKLVCNAVKLVKHVCLK